PGGAIRLGPPQELGLAGVPEEARATWDGMGRLLAATDRRRQQAVVFDPATSSEVARLGVHPHIRYPALSPDGRWVATSTWGGSECPGRGRGRWYAGPDDPVRPGRRRVQPGWPMVGRVRPCPHLPPLARRLVASGARDRHGRVRPLRLLARRLVAGARHRRGR